MPHHFNRIVIPLLLHVDSEEIVNYSAFTAMTVVLVKTKARHVERGRAASQLHSTWRRKSALSGLRSRSMQWETLIVESTMPNTIADFLWHGKTDALDPTTH
jgi:hypothetical protein